VTGDCNTGSDASIHGAWTKGGIGLPPGQMVPPPHQHGAGDGNIGSDASIHGAQTKGGFGLPPGWMVPPPHQRGAGDGNIGSDASIHGALTMRGFGVPRNQAPPQQETGWMVKRGKSDRTGVKQRKCPTIVTCEAARESVISRSYPPGNAVARTG